jgi:hypothetical protein
MNNSELKVAPCDSKAWTPRRWVLPRPSWRQPSYDESIKTSQEVVLATTVGHLARR